MDLMIRLKELQRRIDQVIGVQKMSEKERVKSTVMARLIRLEDEVASLSTRMDVCLELLHDIRSNK
jgi:hypothetical protein